MINFSPIGVQLFSLPEMLEDDFEGTIKMLSQLGYREIELYGPFPFSATSAKEGWNAVTPMLGFSGSGFFGHKPEMIRHILQENNMAATSAHTDLDTLENKMNNLADAASVIGYEYVVLPAIPDERRQNLEDYKRMAETFNRIGQEAAKYGLKFAYHNHGYGLMEEKGFVPLEVLLNNTDPDTVFLEMDIFWTTAGGIDPIDYLQKYTSRYHLMHIKDMTEVKHFAGDGGTADQWIELFPFIASAGQGVLDLETILRTGREHGVKHFYVEQDMVADPKTALKLSYDYLQEL